MSNNLRLPLLKKVHLPVNKLFAIAPQGAITVLLSLSNGLQFALIVLLNFPCNWLSSRERT